ncbi:hypothetical protein [Sporosalibacterium faouarense]|uniref:hypothetical protein n=1 Tax=Sporosalibacterium faouarense TaxID=516123 RepID=UPI00192C8EAA|nr:hypothetical protein [Sporosalibacterium faouarense]
MKKIICIIISIVLLGGVISCDNETSKAEIENNVTDNLENNDNIILPLSITKAAIDMNNDGKNETIRVVLLNGVKLENNKYKGNFALELLDEKGNKSFQININGNSDIILEKNFDIKFKDYNGDDILDFNIGYSSLVEEKEYLYHFYTINKEGKLEELNINGNDTVLESCEKGYSYDFKINTNDTFFTYDYDGERYVYKHYRWEDDNFIVANYIYSPIDIKDINEDSIKEKIDEIVSSSNITEEKDILDSYEKQYNWLLEHSAETKIYLFMKASNEYEHRKIEGLLYSKIGQLERINTHFDEYFNINDIRECLIRDIKQLESPYGKDDYKYSEYTWEVGNKNYKVLAGSFHLDSFVFLFNQSGQYLDGYMWTNKTRDEVNVVFRDKQNYITVSPIRMAYGTGISQFGGQWFEIYKDKLLKSFEHPIKGYSSPPYTLGYTQRYKIINESYDNKTGDFRATYKLGLGLYGTDKLIGIEKIINYHWNTDTEKFQYADYDIHDQLYTLLFVQGIEDDILNENLKEIELIIEKPGERKEENMKETTIFLTKCSSSETRDELLKKIYTWFISNKDLGNSEEFIKIIKEKISIN